MTGEWCKRDGARNYSACLGALGKLATSVVREDSPPVYSELELQSLWFSGAFGREFTTLCGKPVFVRQFGHWNHAAGPDFADCAIVIDGEEKVGAIELDREAKDWERHGHAVNPNYDRVVLHVFFNGGTEAFFSRTSTHANIPQVQLTLDGCEEVTLPEGLAAEARAGRCSYHFQTMPMATVLDFLQAAADYRLERKGRLWKRLAEIHGRDEALYQGVAEALGYRRNRFPMRVLSQRLPLKRLRMETSPMAESLLFGLAGFLEGPRHVESDDPETTAYQRDLWSHWWQARESLAATGVRPLPWQNTGVRPGNHPQRRLAALAQLIHRWPAFQKLAWADGLDHKRILAFMTSLKHDYWDYHYTLKAARSPRRLALIGKARVWDFLANQIIPLRFADDPVVITSQYHLLPALLDNEKVRRATIRLFGNHPDRKAFTKYLYQQQALIQIYDDFCLADTSECDDCPFPEQLWV